MGIIPAEPSALFLSDGATWFLFHLPHILQVTFLVSLTILCKDKQQ